MRLKRDRPNSAQPPKNPSYPISPQATGGNVPNRAMSVSMKQSREQQQHPTNKGFSSLSTAYSNQGVRQRPSISSSQDQTKLFPPGNPDLTKIQGQGDWPDGKGGEGSMSGGELEGVSGGGGGGGGGGEGRGRRGRREWEEREEGGEGRGRRGRREGWEREEGGEGRGRRGRREGGRRGSYHLLPFLAHTQ